MSKVTPEQQLKIYKTAEVKNQVFELLDQVIKDINVNFVEKVINSGAISEDLMKPDSFILAKLIVTAYFENKQPYYPSDSNNKRELKNLAYFI